MPEITPSSSVPVTNPVVAAGGSGGVLDRIKQRWKAHVEKNKKRAEENKKNLDAVDQFIRDFDPQTDKKKLTPEIRAKIIEMEKTFRSGTVSIKDIVAPASMTIATHSLMVNSLHVRTLLVFAYPRYVDSGWMNQLINFDASIDISFFIYPRDSETMLKILRKKVAEMRSTQHMNQEKGLVESVGLETALEDAQRLRVELQRGKEKFFELGLYISIYGETEEKVERTTKQIETILGGKMVMTRRADFRTERAFESTLPQATDMVEVLRNMNTSPLSTTFPFVSSNLSAHEGVLYGINRHNNSLVIFDRFKLENANSVIFAKSGAGKSYAMKLEIIRSMMMGTDIIVIDPENEYEELSRTLGGAYTRISLASSHRINPFDLLNPIEGDESNTEALLKENIINLTGLMNLMLGKLTPDEDGIMDKALRQVYEIKGITAAVQHPMSYEMPTMRDLQKVLSSMEGGRSLATRLEKYTEGTFSGIFSEQTNVDLESGLICFCIRDLEDQLRPIAMYILLNFIWGRIRSQMKKRLLMIDEAWHIVQHEDSGHFLHNLVKRARKYYLGITTITQDVEDFLVSPWGKPIITNSSMQILLKQAPAAVETLQKIFNLTDGERDLLLASGVGQGVFFAGDQHAAIQIIASQKENDIITTDPEVLLARRKRS